jgi:hypothetical protein
MLLDRIVAVEGAGETSRNPLDARQRKCLRSKQHVAEEFERDQFGGSDLLALILAALSHAGSGTDGNTVLVRSSAGIALVDIGPVVP